MFSKLERVGSPVPGLTWEDCVLESLAMVSWQASPGADVITFPQSVLSAVVHTRPARQIGMCIAKVLLKRADYFQWVYLNRNVCLRKKMCIHSLIPRRRKEFNVSTVRASASVAESSETRACFPLAVSWQEQAWSPGASRQWAAARRLLTPPPASPEAQRLARHFRRRLWLAVCISTHSAKKIIHVTQSSCCFWNLYIWSAYLKIYFEKPDFKETCCILLSLQNNI